MLKLANRAKMTTSTVGTGTITLGSAATGYQSFADAGVVDGDVVRYVVEDGTAWEIGQGTYTASGTTLSRTVLESSNADSPISLSGSASVFISAAAEDVAQVKVDTYTTVGSTTWTKPTWAKMLKIILIGGGGGGGSGMRDSTAFSRGGGGAGGSGTIVQYLFPASVVGNTETVVVGGGGSGGSSRTADSTEGLYGGNGNPSLFGTMLRAAQGTAGAGGASTFGTGGVARGASSLDANVGTSGGDGARGAGSTSTTTTVATSTGGGGGAGAGASSTTTASGGAGGLIRAATNNVPGTVYADILGGTAGTAGGAGGNGGVADVFDRKVATGGGGGSYATGQATGAGGSGAQPGGGGGGGAASDNGFSSGAGGNGGDGWVRVISWA